MNVLTNVETYCKKHGTNIKQFEKKCGLGNGTVRGWRLGQMPTLRTLAKIERSTGISASTWLKKDGIRE